MKASLTIAFRFEVESFKFGGGGDDSKTFAQPRDIFRLGWAGHLQGSRVPKLQLPTKLHQYSSYRPTSLREDYPLGIVSTNIPYHGRLTAPTVLKKYPFQLFFPISSTSLSSARNRFAARDQHAGLKESLDLQFQLSSATI